MQNLLKQNESCSLSADNLPFSGFDPLVNDSESIKKEALRFINIGVGCNCLVALWEVGVLSKLLENDFINEEDIGSFGNEICIKAALSALQRCGVFDCNNGVCGITKFGRSLVEYIGLITIFFEGYGEVVLNQTKIIKNKMFNLGKLVNWPVVASSSICISQKAIDPILIEEFIRLNVRGTICDLGCGCGVMLSKICKATCNQGLGFEGSSETVSVAKNQLAKDISIEVADITALKGVWEDVTSLIQAFVCHDFVPHQHCLDVINSYLDNFPNLKYFFYVDIVSPSRSNSEIFPGFDYVHGLLGIPTRTYEETMVLFEQSKYRIFKEMQIPDLPNAFIWILAPKERCL